MTVCVFNQDGQVTIPNMYLPPASAGAIVTMYRAKGWAVMDLATLDILTLSNVGKR